MSIDDAARIAAARAYVDALVSHDATQVPLHPDAVRTELGVRTGRSGRHIAASLQRGPQFRLIRAVSGFTATVAGTRVDTAYDVHVRPARLRLAARVTESFEIDGAGQITAIVAVFSVPRRIRPAPPA